MRENREVEHGFEQKKFSTMAKRVVRGTYPSVDRGGVVIFGQDVGDWASKRRVGRYGGPVMDVNWPNWSFWKLLHEEE